MIDTGDMEIHRDQFKSDMEEFKHEIVEFKRQIRAHFLWTMSGFVGLFLLLGGGELGLAILLAHGFGWLK